MLQPTTTAGSIHASDDVLELSRLEERLPPLLSVVAGRSMSPASSRSAISSLPTSRAVAIPVFILALAGAWLLAHVSGRRGPGLARLFLLIQLL
jgi:hypothetical protein